MKILVLVNQFTDGARRVLEDSGNTVEQASLNQENLASFESDADALVVRLGLTINT